MARILQDGFETEGKELDKSYVSRNYIEDMDVGQFVSMSKVNFDDANFHKRGICASRGGYGTKGYCIDFSGGYNNTSVTGLKYDLTKNCNNTSELFYRIWIKPNITRTDGKISETRLIPMIITDIEIETKLNVSDYLNKVDKILSVGNCVLVAENKDVNTYVLDCYCNGVKVYTYSYLYYDQWVKIDVRLKVGENGIFQLRINDKLITTFNGNTGTTYPKYLYIGRPLGVSHACCKCDLDDIAVNDTSGNVNNSWCGNGSIVGLVPTANGSKTMFTPGIEGTQNFENVDDLLPDGDVTYNSSYALNDIDLYKFTIPEEMEIPPTETINAISVTTRAKFVEQPTDIGHIVSDGASETLLSQHKLSNEYETRFSLIQEKSDGTKYKVSDIDNLEFGYKTLEGTQGQEE